MRVLWFTNVPVGAMLPGDRTGSGGWMDALLDVMLRETTIELGVCCISSTLEARTIERQGVIYYSVPMPKTGKRRYVMYRDNDDRNCETMVSLCSDIIARFRPALVHIHGTERAYGMVTRTGIDCPVLLSLQGLITEYATWVNTFGNYSLTDVASFHSPLQTLRGFGPLWDYARTRKQAVRERQVIQTNRYFAGRTDWDRAHLHALNPTAAYFHVGEVLRSEFYGKPWQLRQARLHSIFFANGRGPRRNVECLLQAAALLLPAHPDLRVRIAGTNGKEDRYSRTMSKLARSLGIDNHLDFLGPSSANTIADELRAAHVFVLPSRIENSANSLCEAQLLGVPVVAGYMGGTPSLIEEGQTGLLVPNGDAALLADAIQRIFHSDKLAEHLSHNARIVALARHNPSRVCDEVVYAYQSIVGGVAP